MKGIIRYFSYFLSEENRSEKFKIIFHKSLLELLNNTNLLYAVQENSILSTYHYKQDERKKYSFFQEIDEQSKVASFCGESQNVVRYLTDAPANIITPIGFIDYMKKLIHGLELQDDIEIFIRDKHWLKSNNFNLVLAVASGSIMYQEPYFLEMHVNRNKNQKLEDRWV